ncbi:MULTISPECIES: hypothetical protein [Streptomyces]|uniref:Uncharacterized protein n=1 Tax=Streptomyces avermitilis TaxID=33903 RepID=A0A499VPR5_STRAX|nr:hypothetical protein [Streptomyces avermitilis]BBJ56424.1 hypothetical protein SAVMC3_90530 [Streptomyces avermitilis]
MRTNSPVLSSQHILSPAEFTNQIASGLDSRRTPYLSPEDAVAAVKTVPKNEPPNSPGFVDRYKRAVDQLAEKRRQKEDAKRRQAVDDDQAAPSSQAPAA